MTLVMESEIVTCPVCRKKNRVPLERTGVAKCGSCHWPLFEEEPPADAPEPPENPLFSWRRRRPNSR